MNKCPPTRLWHSKTSIVAQMRQFASRSQPGENRHSLRQHQQSKAQGLVRVPVNRILLASYGAVLSHDNLRLSGTVARIPSSSGSALKIFTALYGLTNITERARVLRDAVVSSVVTFE